MKNKIILALIATAFVMSGCGKDASVPADNSSVFEKVDQNTGANAESGDGAGENAAESGNENADANAADNNSENAADSTADESAADTDDYTEQIKSEVAALAQDSLSDELAAVNKLYDKYADLTANAPDQTAMNCLCQWGTVVWEDEVTSLLDRLKEEDGGNYDSLHSEYENWLKYVPSMSEKMTYVYEGGSIYPTMHSYNEAMLFKREAYVLASTLADIRKDVAFSFPDNTPCGYYGDYASDTYLIITEGMESGSYNIRIHLDGDKDLRGWGSQEDAPESSFITFTSDDGTVEGRIDCFALGASFYASVSDGAIVTTDETYEFTFKY
ncbi:hypothetical protein [Butyrivibrio sp. XPD2006]|uniref:hypothetical protein n=1 Tax=Butyrivibrio sp. XPD2006 TaxID=1280668 RepID=UPI0003B56E80|nr:hypothetical protein [Butyrivibrio sp. XPD2006]